MNSTERNPPVLAFAVTLACGTLAAGADSPTMSRPGARSSWRRAAAAGGAEGDDPGDGIAVARSRRPVRLVDSACPERVGSAKGGPVFLELAVEPPPAVLAPPAAFTTPADESSAGAAWAGAATPAATAAQTPSATASNPTRPTHAEACISHTPAASLPGFNANSETPSRTGVYPNRGHQKRPAPLVFDT